MLDWQNVFVPFAAGLDEATHPKMVRIDVPLQLENVYFTQEKALSKRNGFSPINTTYYTIFAGGFVDISTDGAIRDLFSTGTELCAVGARRLFVFNEEHGRWYDRGPVSPFTGDQQSVFNDSRSWFATDSYTDGNFTLFAGRWFRHTSDAQWHGIQFRATSFDGSKTFEPIDALRTSSVTVDRPHAPKCAACGTAGVDRQLLVMVGYDGDYTPTQDADFQVWSYALNTPHLTPTSVLTVTQLWFDSYTATGQSAGINDAAYATRTYDIIEGLSGDYIIAYIDRTTQDIFLRRYNSSHVLKASGSIVGVFTRVALHHDGNTLWVIAVYDDPNVLRQVQAFERNLSTFGAIGGGITLHTLTGATSTTVDAQNADHLGVVTTANEVLWTYSLINTVPATSFRNEQRQCFRTTDKALGSLSSEISIFNCLALAKPFTKLGRYYLPCTIGPSFASPGNPSADVYRYPAPGWNASVILDLDKFLPVENVGSEDSETGGSYIVGIYHVGVAPNLANHDTAVTTGLFANRNSFLRGSLNAISVVGNKICYISDRYTYFRQGGINASEGNSPLKPLEAGTGNDAPPRNGGDFILLDFGGAITATRLEKGSAVIGGGAVFFYSGRECFELGFPIAPFLYEREEATASGYSNNKTISYQAAWWCYDGAGFVHRGFPCPNMAERITPGAGGPFTEQIRVNTLPGTSKPVPHAKVYVYDEANNGAEIMNPTMTISNRLQDNESGFFIDRNDFKGAVVPFFPGGVLENVSPGGGALVSVALNRLMVTGQYSLGRIHYSQKFTPGTAFEDALAPEMNEGLGKLFPDGERGTGISEMDGQVILFTAKSIYGMAGAGPNPTGLVGDFDLQLITSDGGCVNGRSVVKFSDGVMFEGSNGISALLRNHDVVPIGEPIQETLAKYPVISGAVLWEKMRLVVFSCHNSAKTDGALLCYDYIAKRWFTWSIKDTTPFFSGLDSVPAGGVFTLPSWMSVDSPSDAKSVRTGTNTVVTGLGKDVARAYSTDGIIRSILIEPTVTNLINDQTFGTGWTLGGTPVLSGATTPAGTSETVQVADDDAAAIESITKTVSAHAAAVAHTLSAWTWQVTLSGGTSSVLLDHDSGSNVPRIDISAVDSDWTYRSNTATTPGGITTTNASVFPASTSDAAQTGSLRVWGLQSEQRSYPTSFIGANDENFTRRAEKLKVDWSYLSVDGYYNFTLTYIPLYTQSETAGDHTLFYAANGTNKLIFRKSDQKLVWTVNGVELTSSALTFNREASISITLKHARDERKLTVTGALTGNGTATAEPLGPAPKGSEALILAGPNGAEEGGGVFLLISNLPSSVPVTALAVHQNELYLSTAAGKLLKYDRNKFKDNVGASDLWITQRFRSAPIQLLQSGWHRCKELVSLAERRSSADLNVNLYRNFEETPFQQEAITSAEIASYEDSAHRTQPKVKPTQQKSQALQFDLFDSDPGVASSGEGYVMAGVVLRMAPKSGTSKVKKEQRR